MIGEILRKTREVYGLSVAELAKESGVSVAKIKAQEADKADLAVEDLLRVDRVLDYDVIWELVSTHDSLAG